MGESKRRKETDKNYGSISNKKIERGIIISSPMIINGRKMTIGGAHIDPTELRFSLLFLGQTSLASQPFCKHEWKR